MKQVATLRGWLVVVVGALGMLNGCSGQPSAPVAATLQVSLSTPFNDDGAVLFTVTGGRVDSVDAAGYTLYTSRTDPATLQVILTGNLSPGIVAHVHIPDERGASQYSATISQVAARETYIERDPASYRLELKR
ncbi:MAG TPA: hypothetical protein VMS62_10165 [Gemmatimonadales bacterium]|nr:hypothetical protein [Gemmatimonadales bacterium]